MTTTLHPRWCDLGRCAAAVKPGDLHGHAHRSAPLDLGRAGAIAGAPIASRGDMIPGLDTRMVAYLTADHSAEQLPATLHIGMDGDDPLVSIPLGESYDEEVFGNRPGRQLLTWLRLETDADNEWVER